MTNYAIHDNVHFTEGENSAQQCFIIECIKSNFQVFFILSFKIKIESSLWLTKIACNFLISKVQWLSGSLLLYLPACTCVSSYCKLFDFLDSVHCVCSLITSMSRFISMQDLCVKKKKNSRTKMLISTSKALICPFSCYSCASWSWTCKCQLQYPCPYRQSVLHHQNATFPLIYCYL